MEILRFDESDVPAPKRKRASKGWLALGLVATLMGVGTAFASSTININGNNLTPLGQGVSTATTCDDQVDVTPNAALILPTPSPSPSEDNLSQEETLDNAPTFRLGSITVSGVNANPTSPTTGIGCGGTDFKIEIYKNRKQGETETFKAERLTCTELGLSAYPKVTDGVGETDPELEFTACDSTSGNDGSIYFRVESAIADKDKPNSIFKIILNASTEFDYVTLVSTNYTPFNS